MKPKPQIFFTMLKRNKLQWVYLLKKVHEESFGAQSLKRYRGSPTSTVSSSTIFTSTVFQCYVLKTVLVEFLYTINRTSGNWLCSTHYYEFRIVRFFQNPKNRTMRGPPVYAQEVLAKSNFCLTSVLTSMRIFSFMYSVQLGWMM